MGFVEVAWRLQRFAARFVREEEELNSLCAEEVLAGRPFPARKPIEAQKRLPNMSDQERLELVKTVFNHPRLPPDSEDQVL